MSQKKLNTLVSTLDGIFIGFLGGYGRILLDLSCRNLHWCIDVFNWIPRDNIRLEKGGLRAWRLRSK